MLQVSWRTLLVAVLFAMLGWYLHAQTPHPPPTYTIARGTVSATEDEARHCTFNIGNMAYIVYRYREGIDCLVMTDLVGRAIRLQAVMEHVASTP